MENQAVPYALGNNTKIILGSQAGLRVVSWGIPHTHTHYRKQSGFYVSNPVAYVYTANAGHTKAETTFGIEARNTFLFAWFLEI